jgi:hypothetical protein
MRMPASKRYEEEIRRQNGRGIVFIGRIIPLLRRLDYSGAGKAITCVIGIIIAGRARWGTSGALYPQSAPAGRNSLSRSDSLGLPGQVVMKVRSRAARTREPGQVRKEAAVSGYPWVT